MQKSVIIIGGGLGGLFTGAILAKEGVKVTLIEKNTTLGGGLQSFTRFGEVFDTGMHVIGGMQEGGNIRRICEYLGVYQEMKIADVDPDCIDLLYFAEDKTYYKIAKGKEGFVDSLAQYFPEERENLKRYVAAMFALVDEMDLFYLRPARMNLFAHSEDFIIAANDFVAKYIQNSKLRSVVSYMNPLYSGKEDMTPSFIHAVISVLYINGPSRFVDGSHLFAESLGKVITQHGGQIILNDGVAHVKTFDHQITGVQTRKGLDLSADYYISAVHPCSFVKLLEDPKALPKAYRNRLEEIPNSYSAFTLNIKLKPNTIRYMNYTAYYMTRYADIWKFGRMDMPWPLGFLYMTPPISNQGEYSNKMIVTAPMPFEMVKAWEDTRVGHRGETYETWKKECQEKLLDCMEEMIPHFRDCIECINTASPLTIRDYYGVKEGCMCGYSKDWKNITLSQVPVVTKIPNLLLTGQNNNLHGFCGVPLTAINTSEVILGKDYVIQKINEMTHE